MELVIEWPDGSAVDFIDLHEVTASFSEIGEGGIQEYVVHNKGNSRIRDLTIGLEGVGSENAQLAMGADPVWAAPGEGLAFSGVLEPGQKFIILARGIFDPENAEGMYDFRLVLKGVSF